MGRSVSSTSVTAGDVGADAFVRPAEHCEAYPRHGPKRFHCDSPLVHSPSCCGVQTTNGRGTALQAAEKVTNACAAVEERRFSAA